MIRRWLSGALLSLLFACAITHAAAPPRPFSPEQKKELLRRRNGLVDRSIHLQKEGEQKEAVRVALRTVAIQEAIYGPLHDESVRWRGSLAGWLENAGAWPEALQLRREAVAIQRKRFDEDDWRLRDALQELADIQKRRRMSAEERGKLARARKANDSAMRLYNQGKFKQALPAAREALALRQEVLGEKHPLCARALSNLATISQAIGPRDKARQLAEQCVRACREAMGEKHPHYATSLNNLGSLYRKTGEHRKALLLFEKATKLRKELLGDKHPETISALGNLALAYREMGDYRKALPLAEQAARLCKEGPGEKHLYYSTILNNLASIYQAMGDSQKALPLFEEALRATREAMGENHPSYAVSVNNLAFLHKAMGDDTRALVFFRRASNLFKEALGEKHSHYASSLNNLAAVYKDMGDYKRALALFERAAKLRKQALGEKHPDYAASLNNLALTWAAMGSYSKARELCEQSVHLVKESLGEKHPYYAISLNNLASLCQEMGDYNKARALYEQAQRIRQQVLPNEHPEHAASLNSLGLLFIAMGDQAKAKSFLQEAVRRRKQSLGEKHPAYVNSLANLAAAHQETREYDKAQPLLERAVSLRAELLGEKHPDYAVSLVNLSYLHRLRGDDRKALTTGQKALRVQKEALGEKHPAYATSLTNLAGIYRQWGDTNRARILYERAARLRKEVLSEQHPDQGTSLSNLALMDAVLGKTGQAAETASRAARIAQQHLERTFSSASEQQRLLLLAQKRLHLDFLISLHRSAGLPAWQVYEHVLAWRGIVTAAQAEQRLQRDEPALADLFLDLRAARAGLARMANAPPAPAFRKEWLARWEALQKKKDAAEVALAAASTSFRKLQDRLRPTGRMVGYALPEGTAFVDFMAYSHLTPVSRGKRWRSEDRLLAFVVRRNHEVVCHDIGPAKEVEKLVRSWREPFSGRTITAVDAKAAALLRQRIWLPIQMALGDCKKVLIAPDGPLCYLSFAALPGSKRGTFLLEEYTIAYVTSGRRLLDLADPVERPGSEGLLAVGGLDFGKSAGERVPSSLADLPRSWSSLPGTEQEVRRLAALYRKAFPTSRPPLLRTGKQADADRLTRDLSKARFRYVHLATHGLYVPPRSSLPHSVRASGLSLRDPAQTDQVIHDYSPLLRTFIALSNANTNPKAGVWRGEEVAGLDLRGCELVVLSACRTAEGKVIAGEGMLGLQRAFQAAGARSLVSSLWKVHDAATSVLMEEMYRQLWMERRKPAEALRQAQLFVLRNPQRVRSRQQELVKAGVRDPEDEAVELPKAQPKEKAHPALWAPFVFSGGVEWGKGRQKR